MNPKHKSSQPYKLESDIYCYGPQEHAEHEFNAQFDDSRERWAASAIDPEIEAYYAEESEKEEWDQMTDLEREHQQLAWNHEDALRENARRDAIKNDPIPF